jgi:hypothetical protein
MTPPHVCTSFQAAAEKMPLTASATDWPDKLKIEDVVFPEWTNLDPRKAVALAEQNYLAEQEIYWDTAPKNDPKFYQDVLRGRSPPNDLDFRKWWAASQLPIYTDSLSKGTLKFGQTKVSGLNGQDGDIVIFRFRIEDPGRTEIQTNLTPVHALHEQLYNNWRYTVRIYSSKTAYSDYTIGIGSTPDDGVMAIIQTSIFIFDSWDSYLRTGSLDHVILPAEHPPLMGKELNVEGLCNLAIGKE